ncbi:restriction endonuclease subunit M [Sulfodiicoccus acidiphilus]|uniref:DNA (cytosine-5-)-methyltransferase n=1 Tax=Sulfodiicoccus acidiphilus TaxID=1670455 RepID=A0A348B1B9_9CREN|nr:DNA cytosine methyltransferase [Sulfodiicoccus acidiphilus]BBD71971.1 restriction endonuclease subunit M [Sulfodiicoccus acidiphilus]GGT91857.1 restriction endonuclease subunit M [Sulfodiicoccus acidiphilus]
MVDLFSGGGGFSRGFAEVGLSPALGVELNHAAARTYSLNFPEAQVLEEDIREVDGSLISKLVGEVDILIGSPPCEPFTAANPTRRKNPIERLYSDERGLLTLEFVRLVGELNPRVFVMENVPALVESVELREALRAEFARVGYEIHFNVLSALELGNPSKRVRIFISNARLDPPKVTLHPSVWESIGDLDGKEGKVPNHEVREVTEAKLRKISRLGYGGYLTMFEGSARKIPLYLRLDPSKPAPTVLGNSRFIHPFRDRWLTVREQARLMGYPDDHVFLGSLDEQFNQVGESVPVPVARAVAKEVSKLF